MDNGSIELQVNNWKIVKLSKSLMKKFLETEFDVQIWKNEWFKNMSSKFIE